VAVTMKKSGQPAVLAKSSEGVAPADVTNVVPGGDFPRVGVVVKFMVATLAIEERRSSLAEMGDGKAEAGPGVKVVGQSGTPMLLVGRPSWLTATARRRCRRCPLKMGVAFVSIEIVGLDVRWVTKKVEAARRVEIHPNGVSLRPKRSGDRRLPAEDLETSVKVPSAVVW